MFQNLHRICTDKVLEMETIDRKKHNQIEYLIVCISAFAEKYNLSMAQAYSYLKRFTGINFLIDFYDIEHTLSIENAVEDLQQLCFNEGGKII